VALTRLAPIHPLLAVFLAQLGLRVQLSLLAAHNLQPHLAQAAHLGSAAVGVVLPQLVCLGLLQVQASQLGPLAAVQECSHPPATCQCFRLVTQLLAQHLDARLRPGAGALAGGDVFCNDLLQCSAWKGFAVLWVDPVNCCSSTCRPSTLL
jgi:hypothetical protein